MLTVYWVTCEDNRWCSLERVDLSSVQTSGVYAIWHGGIAPRYVRIGSGDIRQRLSEHRRNPEIMAFAAPGLFVTWASVHPNQQPGVEAFLAKACNPILGERFPCRIPIPVNLPGAAALSSSLHP